MLAALLIDKVTGRPYAVEMHRRILRPLGLSGTVVPGSWPGIPGPHAHARTNRTLWTNSFDSQHCDA